MPTCRTCEFGSLVWVCEEQHRGTGPNRTCGSHKPRETPLLVDALVQALNDTLEALNRAICPDSGWAFDETIQAAQAALTRHYKEVGDAKA